VVGVSINNVEDTVILTMFKLVKFKQFFHCLQNIDLQGTQISIVKLRIINFWLKNYEYLIYSLSIKRLKDTVVNRTCRSLKITFEIKIFKRL